MDDLIMILGDFQPAAFIMLILTCVAVASGMTAPQIGPWVSLITLAGVTAYVGNRVMAVDPRPAWLLPLALGGLLAAVGAGARLVGAIRARSNNDRTVGYVFPTVLAIAALWLSIALIEYDATITTATR